MIKFPLNEPLKTVGGYDAMVLFYNGDGEPCGWVEYNGKQCVNWCVGGKTENNEPKSWSLIPPKPRREIGYASYLKSTGRLYALRSDLPPTGLEFMDPVRFPIPRPGETLCVRPSREDVSKVLHDHGKIITTAVVDGLMALFDGEE